MQTELETQFELEEDGRWIAEIPILPGVLAYGLTKGEARMKVNVLAHEVLAEGKSIE